MYEVKDSSLVERKTTVWKRSAARDQSNLFHKERFSFIIHLFIPSSRLTTSFLCIQIQLISNTFHFYPARFTVIFRLGITKYAPILIPRTSFESSYEFDNLNFQPFCWILVIYLYRIVFKFVTPIGSQSFKFFCQSWPKFGCL